MYHFRINGAWIGGQVCLSSVLYPLEKKGAFNAFSAGAATLQGLQNVSMDFSFKYQCTINFFRYFIGLLGMWVVLGI